jgi:N4-gp56 family major capsid protein
MILLHQKKRMPRKGGRFLRMRRYDKLSTATVPLGNSGVTPPGQQLSAVDIDAEVQFYGTYVKINEQVTLQSQDPVLNETANLLGISLRETEDELIRDMLASTAVVQSCVNGVNGDVPTEITYADVQLAVKQLLSNDAKSLMSNIEGADKYGTSPVRNSYFALGHSDLSTDLENQPFFVHTSQYPSQQNILEAEWGSISNMRFLLSSQGSKVVNGSALNNNLYNVFCIGLESYACVEQDGYSAQFIYRPPIYDGPLAQNVTLGYKFGQATRILNDAWIVNLQCTAS